jgi:hypothetical protein
MKKVLVVEDNRDNLRLITYALERHGYEVIAAETGVRGVELAISERPLFSVMDINLPDIDGYEATRHIRASEANGNIPIIAITHGYHLLTYQPWQPYSKRENLQRPSEWRWSSNPANSSPYGSRKSEVPRTASSSRRSAPSGHTTEGQPRSLTSRSLLVGMVTGCRWEISMALMN